MKNAYLTLTSKKLFVLTMMTAGLGIAPQTSYAEQAVQNITQAAQLKGQVVGSNGEPIIGATIMVKGTKNGTVTDFDGNFSISNVQSGTLVISYVGYKTKEIAFHGTAPVNVTLAEDSKALDEVVVVGYGTQKKSDVTGSVTSVNKDRLSQLPVTNVMQALEGATSGVLVTQSSSIPGSGPSTVIRGKNSINASTDPYVVVDGIPISKTGGSISDINPNDIESMEILKDASAVAIYGTNGANGVILITTKRGKAGHKPTIRYNGYFGIEDYAHKLEMRNGSEYVQKYKDYMYQKTGKEVTGDPVPNTGEQANYEAGKETDWLDEISQTGITMDHNLSISGGTDDVSYFVSGEYMNQKGILKGYQYKRFSFRANLDIKVTKYLTIGTNAYVASHNKDGGRVNFLMGLAMSPYGQEYNDDGSYNTLPMSPEEMYVSPFCNYNKTAERRSVNVNGNGYAELNFGNLIAPLKGLKYRLNIGYNYLPARTPLMPDSLLMTRTEQLRPSIMKQMHIQ